MGLSVKMRWRRMLTCSVGASVRHESNPGAFWIAAGATAGRIGEEFDSAMCGVFRLLISATVRRRAQRKRGRWQWACVGAPLASSLISLNQSQTRYWLALFSQRELEQHQRHVVLSLRAGCRRAVRDLQTVRACRQPAQFSLCAAVISGHGRRVTACRAPPSFNQALWLTPGQNRRQVPPVKAGLNAVGRLPPVRLQRRTGHRQIRHRQRCRTICGGAYDRHGAKQVGPVLPGCSQPLWVLRRRLSGLVAVYDLLSARTAYSGGAAGR
jgi:hypothetical protein